MTEEMEEREEIWLETNLASGEGWAPSSCPFPGNATATLAAVDVMPLQPSGVTTSGVTEFLIENCLHAFFDLLDFVPIITPAFFISFVYTYFEDGDCMTSLDRVLTWLESTARAVGLTGWN